MDQFKSLLTSRTIWANIVLAVASIIAVWGFSLTPDQQSTIVTVIVTLGALASSFFRAQATQQLVGSGNVASVANAHVANGLTPDRALRTAKAQVADASQNVG
jgi:uncharacterized protein (DUF697 family)